MTLFISDLDGTLLNSNIALSTYSVNALNEMISKGLNFTVATARTYATAGKILSELRLNLPIILMNGVLIYNPVKEKYEQINKLDDSLCDYINRLRKALELECFMYTITDNKMMTYFESLSSKPLRDFYDERMQKYYKTFTQIEDFDSVNADKIYFTFIDCFEKLSPLFEELKQNEQLYVTFYKDIYSEKLWYLEVLSSKASKKNAVLWLKSNYNFTKSAVFGDNLNDLPMFEACEEKYAVKNANQAVIEKCDKIIGSNNNDGVANYLLKHWKGN